MTSARQPWHDTLRALLRERSVLDADIDARLEVEEIGTFTTRVDRVRIVYPPAAAATRDRPDRLVVKSSVPGRSDRLGERFEHEIRFYRELASRVPARTPRFYGGVVDPVSGLGLLALEDVAGIAATDWLAGPDESHARRGVAALAKLHAAFWEDVEDLAWVPSFDDQDLLARFEQAYAAGWHAWRDFFEQVVPGFGALGERLLGHVTASHRVLGEEPTLLHGDAHAENLPLAAGANGDEIVMLDWAGPRRGNAGVDLGFFIAMSFPASRRQGVEAALVTHHDEALRKLGVSRRTDPWLAYRRGVLRRITRLVAIAPAWSPEGLDSLKMVFHRCATAALELELAELVD